MKHILLTTEQADEIRGPYGNYSYLDPYLISKGDEIKWGLPDRVLNDPEYMAAYSELETCPIEDGWVDVIKELKED